MAKSVNAQTSPETITAIVGKPSASSAEAHSKARYQKGEALATLVIRSAQADAEAETQRAGKRGVMIKSLMHLDKEGHQAFRDQLKAELDLINENTANESTFGGHSVNYYRVLVSCWRVISVGIQAGVNAVDAGGTVRNWDELLTECRAMKKAASTSAVSTKDTEGKSGMRKSGAGRKPAESKGVTLAQVMQLADQLGRDDQLQLMAHLAKITKPKTGEMTAAKEAVVAVEEELKAATTNGAEEEQAE